MLAQLSTVKSRLAIPDADTSHDALLTRAIRAVSARFDKETNRTLARTENATREFGPADTEISPLLYPIETVTKWETKSSESEGWLEQPAPDFLIRYFVLYNSAFTLAHTPHKTLGSANQPSYIQTNRGCK